MSQATCVSRDRILPRVLCADNDSNSARLQKLSPDPEGYEVLRKLEFATNLFSACAVLSMADALNTWLNPELVKTEGAWRFPQERSNSETSLESEPVFARD